MPATSGPATGAGAARPGRGDERLGDLLEGRPAQAPGHEVGRALVAVAGPAREHEVEGHAELPAPGEERRGDEGAEPRRGEEKEALRQGVEPAAAGDGRPAGGGGGPGEPGAGG